VPKPNLNITLTLTLKDRHAFEDGVVALEKGADAMPKPNLNITLTLRDGHACEGGTVKGLLIQRIGLTLAQACTGVTRSQPPQACVTL